MKRRTLLLSGVGALGALVVGWSVLPARSRLGSPAVWPPVAGSVPLNGWIKIAPDGSVVLAMARSEMGQGVYTALPMLVAEELDVPLTSVHTEQAGYDAIYGNVAGLVASLPFHPSEAEGSARPMKVRLGEWMVGKIARELGISMTGGSSSVADAWDVLRIAAASARAALLAAAAAEWKLPVSELQVKDGIVSHPSGKSGNYGQWAQVASSLAPSNVTLKARQDWRVIGQGLPRLDIPSKVNGSAQYGLDVRLPGMVFAAVRMCPILGGGVAKVGSDAALAMRGVVKVVPLPAAAGSTAGVAVVASSWWHAQQAVQALQVQWQAGPQGLLDSAAIQTQLAKAAHSGADAHVFYEQGQWPQPAAADGLSLEAQYSAPYLAHATMEPMNCTARVADGAVEIWAPTQAPGLVRAAAAKAAGVPVDKVTVHLNLLGGGFGRRLEVDSAVQAVHLAMQTGGAPVQLIWSREEDTTHDFYRPMLVAQVRGGLDAQGGLDSLFIQSAGDAITPRQMERAMPSLAGPFDLPDKTTAEGLFDIPYAIPNQHMAHVATRMGVPVGYWRSVGHSHNAFVTESFIDEMAALAKQDPLDFRRKLLRNAPRHLAVLELAAVKAGWGQALPSGHAQGIALHESFGSTVAEVVEISVQDGKPKVHKVVCAIDCGTVVNPSIVAQQLESAVVFALTAALYGRIDIAGGVVQQKSFPDYPMLHLADAPQVQTWIVPSTGAPTGVGEPGVPPLAPALANAWAKLSGQRLRQLPLGFKV